MLLSRRTLLLGGAALSLAGCGGSEPLIDLASLPRVRPKVTLHWAQQGRALNAPSTANYVDVTVRSLLAPEEIASLLISRTTNLEHTLTYELPLAIPAGPVELTARFFDRAFEGSDETHRTLVAVAQGQVELRSENPTLPDVVVEGRIAQLKVLFRPTLLTNDILTTGFEARDSQGNLLALQPHLPVYEIVEGAGSVLREEAAAPIYPYTSAALVIRGLAPGTGRVRVRLGDTVSAPVAVSVVASLSLAEGIRCGFLDLAELVWDESRQRFWCVDRALTGSNTLYRFDPLTWTTDVSFTIPGGGLQRIVLTPDSTSLYGYSDGSRTVVRIRLADGVIQERIPVKLPYSSFNRLPHLCPLPGASNTVLISGARLGSYYNDEAWIYDGEVARPNTVRTVLAAAGMSLEPNAVYLGTTTVRDDGSYAYFADLGAGTYGWRVAIGPEGFVVGSLEAVTVGRPYLGQLLALDGMVYDLATGAPLTTTSLGSVVPSTPLQRRYLGFPYNTSDSLSVVRATPTFEPATYALPTGLPYQASGAGGASNWHFPPQGWGAKGVALLASPATGATLPLLVILDQIG